LGSCLSCCQFWFVFAWWTTCGTLMWFCGGCGWIFWRFIPLLYPGINGIWIIYKNVTYMCTCAFLWGCIDWAHMPMPTHQPSYMHPFPSILNPSATFPIISSLAIGYYTLAWIYDCSSLIWFIVCLPNGHFIHL
jgi:hypothetical protein